MQKSGVYHLKNVPRQFHFPFPLEEVGWLPHHYHAHENNCLDATYVCIGTNWEDLEYASIINGKLCRGRSTPGTYSFSLLRPGTQMTTVRTSYHDELFFRYEASQYDPLCELFQTKEKTDQHFSFTSLPEEIVSMIRHELLQFETPGAADRIDQLALLLITEILTRHRQAQSKESSKYSLKLQAIAAEYLAGARLKDLLHEYGMSERTFYRSWQKAFSCSPAEYFARNQIRLACTLLRNTNLPPAEIAEKCGFSTVNYFYQKFKKALQISPMEYRSAHKVSLFEEPAEKSRKKR